MFCGICFSTSSTSILLWSLNNLLCLAFIVLFCSLHSPYTCSVVEDWFCFGSSFLGYAGMALYSCYFTGKIKCNHASIIGCVFSYTIYSGPACTSVEGKFCRESQWVSCFKVFCFDFWQLKGHLPCLFPYKFPMLESSLVDCLIWLQDQLGRVTLLSGILFIMLGLSTDSAPSLISSRAPPPSMMGLPPFPASLEGYKYVILKLGPLQLTKKGLSTATTSACLTFTVSSDLPFVVEST